MRTKKHMEEILACHLAKIVPELRLVEADHYVCHLYHRRYANIGDIVEAATELHFFPQTLRFSGSGDYHLEWGLPPTILLDMEFCNQGVRSLFRLILEHDCFGVELERIRFGNSREMETKSAHSESQRLSMALNDACLRKIR